MNVNMIILFIAGILFGIACVKLLQYEWNRLEKTDVGQKMFWAFGIALAVANVILLVVMMMVYPEQTPYGIFRDMTVVSIVWMAAVMDYKFYVIPNETILAGAIMWVILTVYKAIAFRELVLTDLMEEACAFVVLAIALGVCLLLMKNSIGMGDVKLLLLLSLYLGMADLFSIVFLALLCAFVGAVVALIRKTKSRSDAMPFGPFLFVGTYFGMLLSGI